MVAFAMFQWYKLLHNKKKFDFLLDDPSINQMTVIGVYIFKILKGSKSNLANI